MRNNLSKFTKNEVGRRIKEVFKKIDLIKIQQKTLMAEDEHEGYKAYMIVTLGEICK